MNIKNISIKFEDDYDDNAVLLATSVFSLLKKSGYCCTLDNISQWGKEDLNIDAVIHIQGHAPYITKPWNYNILLERPYDLKPKKKIFADNEIEERNYDAIHAGQDFELTLPALLADAVSKKSTESLVETRIITTKEKMIDPKFCTDGPLVSIFMGTYNRRKYLPRAINSIIAQSYKNWELCLVNDAGEAVDDIVESYNDARIKLINHKENMRLGHVFNRAFTESHGEYITYLGDDDTYLPKHLEILMRGICHIPSLAFVYSDARQITVVKNSYGKEKIVDRAVLYDQQVSIEHLLENNFITGISVLHERSLFLQAGSFDPRLSVLIDFDMWRRMACYTYTYHISAVTAEYFVHKNREESHLTDIAHTNSELYSKNRLKIIFKRLAIENNPIYKNELTFLRKKELFHHYTLMCKNIVDNAENTENTENAENLENNKLLNTLLKGAQKNYVEEYLIQIHYAICLIKTRNLSQALDVFRDVILAGEKKHTELFMALYCALELHDEYAFTLFRLLSENKEKMNEQERIMLKNYSLRIRTVFGKRYYEWSKSIRSLQT